MTKKKMKKLAAVSGIETPDVTRRNFLMLGAAGLGVADLGSTLLSACEGEEGAAPAEAPAPGTPDIRFGIIALTDNSPIVSAQAA